MQKEICYLLLLSYYHKGEQLPTNQSLKLSDLPSYYIYCIY